MATLYYESSFAHHGIKGQKWGVRRFQTRSGKLTRAGRKHVAEIRNKMAEDPEIPKMISRMEEANRNYEKANKPMTDFLNNQELSSKYINDWVKKHPEYPDEPEYDRYEWRSAMQYGGYDLPPYKNYAKDYNIDWKKQKSNYRNARDEQYDARDDYTFALVEKYGDKSISDSYSVVDHIVILEALRIAGERKLM